MSNNSDWVLPGLLGLQNNGSLDDFDILIPKNLLADIDLEQVMLQAAAGGHLEVCKWLWERGNKKFDFYGPLSAASKNRHEATCEWLIEKWAEGPTNAQMDGPFGRRMMGELVKSGWVHAESSDYCSKAHFECNLKKGFKKANIVEASFLGVFTQVQVTG